jgi:hypothetical protein
MDDEERRRIISEARQNLDPIRRKEEQAELVNRLMVMPAEDPVAKWKKDAEEIEAARERSRADLAEAKSASWNEIDARIHAAVESAVQRERAFILEVVAGALGQLSAEQHQKDRSALNRETEKLWSVLSEIQKTIANLNKAERRVPIEDVIRRTH